LFIMVAESMLILGPMLQLGCFRAWAAVAWRRRSGSQVRNGPPEAVAREADGERSPRRRKPAPKNKGHAPRKAARPTAASLRSGR
jgi:hypothetical protein